MPALLPPPTSRRLSVVNPHTTQSSNSVTLVTYQPFCHGRVNESHAAQLYVKKVKANGWPVAIQECGLCLQQEY